MAKKLKNPFPELVLAKTGDEMGQEREKKILVPNSVHTRPVQEKFRKKFKKLKNLFPALFLANMGWDRLRKREKNLSPKFRSFSTRLRKFRKK